MTGIGGHGPGAGFDYKTFFQGSKPSEIEEGIKGGLNEEKCINAAIDSLSELAAEFEKTHSDSTKEQFIELVDKFIKVFPEETRVIKDINKVASESFGIEKAVKPVIIEKEDDEEEGIKFDELPVMTFQETIDHLKEEPIGAVIARRSSDMEKLVIAIKTEENFPPNFGVEQYKFAPGEEAGTFIDDETGNAFTIEDLLVQIQFQLMLTSEQFALEQCRMAVVADSPDEVNELLKEGVNKKVVLKAAEEVVKETIIDLKLSLSDLTHLFENIKSAGKNYSFQDSVNFTEAIADHIVYLQALITESDLPNTRELEILRLVFGNQTTNPLYSFFNELIDKGFQAHLKTAMESFTQKLNSEDLGEKFKQLSNEDATAPEELAGVVDEFLDLQKLANAAHTALPQALIEEFTKKIVLPLLHSVGSPELQKALAGNYSELTFDELIQLSVEIGDFEELPIPHQLSIPSLAEQVLLYIDSHQEEIRKNPALATRAHKILHELAQVQIAQGNIESAFSIEAKAAGSIPLSTAHPLHDMDQAIKAGTARQVNTKLGAYFSSLDSSIVKGGNLHAVQRTIDGKLLDCFDFKVSHYARDELTKHLDAILKHPDKFKAALPPDLCSGIKINKEVPQQFVRYNETEGEYTRKEGYSPGDSKGTEIVFEGVGKVIIGNNPLNGTMYNMIQVEMDPNLPAGVGVKKLQQMLAVIGLGPVLGEQPPEADERMKIAQLFRAFYPAKSTSFDTKKEFYQLPIEDLRKEIISREPGMEAVFEKYLDTEPELMTKISILPGKEVWGIKDLGEQIRAQGAWGLMTGVGKGSWLEARSAIERILTQGALSSEQRFSTGIFKEGGSSEEDLLSGGGDQVFSRMIGDQTAHLDTKDFTFHGNAQILWDLDQVVQRVPYGHYSDKYGMKNRFATEEMDLDKNYGHYQRRSNLMRFAGKADSASNEVMAKNALDPSHVIGVVVDEDDLKEDLIKHLLSKGIAEEEAPGKVFIKYAGKRIDADDFIHVGKQFEKDWWG